MNFVSAIFRIALKLVLIAAAAVFALSLIVVALLSVVWVLLKALLTGRKPAFVTTFQRFNQARQQFKRGDWATRSGPGFVRPTSDDVVDVQAHEVQAQKARGALPLDH